MRFAPRRRVRSPERDSIPGDDPYPPPPSPTIPQQSDPPMTPVPTVSPYHPAPLTIVPGRLGTRRWAWVPGQLSTWRDEEIGPYYEVGESSHTTPTCPVTEEPTYQTIPLLIARLHRHDTQIERLENDMVDIPDPNYFPRLHQEFLTLRGDHRDLRDHHEQLEGRILSDFDSMVHRIDSFEETLASLRSMMEELRVSTRHIARGDPNSEREGH